MASKQNLNKGLSDKWRRGPNNWILGIFYFNKEDKRLFPPKRIEWMGWTVNFANPKSLALFGLVIAFFVIYVKFFKY